MTLIAEPERIIDGIKCFSRNVAKKHHNYNARHFEKILTVERNHFWFITRRERIIRSFLDVLPINSRVLEIGAGTAYISEGLQNAGYRIAVGDLHFSGLQHARTKGIDECYQFDLLDPPFIDEFDAIGVFDVLEHLNDDTIGIAKITGMLKKGGKLFITVPAYQWLWSRIDNVAAHKRRYNKNGLIRKVEFAGLKVLNTEYLFKLILPLLYMRHLLDGGTNLQMTKNEKKYNDAESLLQINPLLNQVLLRITRLENTISEFFPHGPGGSILMVAEKK